MKQNKFKVAYLKPYTEVVVINNETLLTETSFLGQHKPARRKTGPTANNAKQESEWLEVGDNVLSSNEHTSLWED
jgi:hypothetical protein